MKINTACKLELLGKTSKSTSNYLLCYRSFDRKEAPRREDSDMNNHLGKHVLEPVNKCDCSLQTQFWVGMDLVLLFITQQENKKVNKFNFAPQLRALV